MALIETSLHQSFMWTTHCRLGAEIIHWIHRRSTVYAVVGDVKSSASRSNLPLAPFLIEALQAWCTETPHAKSSDWIFASPRRGKRPYRGNSIVRRQLKLATKKTGITTPVGWHTFRRSIATWLIENEENVKITQEILRHRHVGTTLDLYAKPVTQTKRQAQQKIVNQLLAAQKRSSETADFECFGVVQ
jgi:integrase